MPKIKSKKRKKKIVKKKVLPLKVQKKIPDAKKINITEQKVLIKKLKKQPTE